MRTSAADLKKDVSDIPRDIPQKMKDFWEEYVMKGPSLSSSTEQTGFSRSATLTVTGSRSEHLHHQRSEYESKTTKPSYDLASHLTMSSIGSANQRGHAMGRFMQPGIGHARTTRQATFHETDRKAAIKMVQRGQIMEVLSQEHGLGTHNRWACIDCCCHCIKRCSKLINAKATCFFVVMDNQNGLSELRWDSNPDRARTQLAQGRLLLSDIRDVTPMLVQDVHDENVDLPVSRKFRVIHGHSALKLWAPDREAMKQWCVALVALMRYARGSNMRTKKGPDIALRGYINQIFMSIADKGGKADGQVTHIAPPELAGWLRKLNICASDEYVGDIIQEFDKDDNQALDLEEFSELFHMLTVKESLVQWFDKYATLIQPQSGIAINGKTEIDFSSAHRAMSAERFQLFLELEQSDRHFFSLCNSIDELFTSLPEPYTEVIEGETLLTQAGFSRLICCAENDLFDPERRARVFQDMTQPLSHYWIATSHNTYLEGHQLVGLSSLEQYMDVLLRGARCVEIDCWDGEDGEPMVTHGWTATSRLQFKDVIRVCRDYAFVTSHYPLILSLEVHCSHEQRCRMATILIDILGDKLLLPTADAEERSLTSPEDARNKVIIKAKVKSRNDQTFNTIGSNGAKRDRKISSRSRRGLRSYCCFLIKCICCCPCVRRRRRSRSSVIKGRCSDNDVDDDPYDVEEKESGMDAEGAKELSDVVYLEGVPKPEVDKLNIADICSETYPCTCISVNDTKAGRLVDSNGLQALQRYAKHQILRVYPAAKRVGSSNFDPFSMWLAGVQMVALNYQSLDLPVICNEGLFLHENGGSGYVLKPALVRGLFEPSSPADSPPIRETSYQNRYVAKKADVSGVRRIFTTVSHAPSSQPGTPSPRARRQSPRSSKTTDEESMDLIKVRAMASSTGSARDREDALGVGLVCTLELTVLSAHSLPKPCGAEEAGIVSPLVRASVCGLPEDRRCAETCVITDNGFNPRWHQLFSFEVSEPSMAMLILEVINVNMGMRRVRREFLAAAALPFAGIREGIRWVPLLDWKHHAIELCGLLVEVRLRGPWAELRRHQRLSRPPAPSSIAGAISRGPGGLNHDNGGVLSAARTKKPRPSVCADSSRGFFSSGTDSPPESPKLKQNSFALGSLESRSLRLETIRDSCSFEDDASHYSSEGNAIVDTPGRPPLQVVGETVANLKDTENMVASASSIVGSLASIAVGDVSSLFVQPTTLPMTPRESSWQAPEEDRPSLKTNLSTPRTNLSTPSRHFQPSQQLSSPLSPRSPHALTSV